MRDRSAWVVRSANVSEVVSRLPLRSQHLIASISRTALDANRVAADRDHSVDSCLGSSDLGGGIPSASSNLIRPRRAGLPKIHLLLPLST